MALVQIDFFSQALMRPVTATVVMPSDKVAIGEDGVPVSVSHPEPFKTLYLLHGIFGNYTDWVTRSRLQQLAEDREVAVVMPSGDNSFYNDHADGSKYGEFIARELVEFTRRTFNLSPRREDTFIGGLSMGGYGAIVNALRNPGVFGSVICLSSALVLDSLVRDAVDDAPNLLCSRPFFESVFGPMDAIAGSENDYNALATRIASSADAPKPRFWMACGTEDSLLSANQAFARHLRDLAFDVTYQEGPGAHTWEFWDAWIEKALAWLPLGAASASVGSGNVQA